MTGTKEILLGKLRSGAPMGGWEQLRLTFLLALPAILAQLSMCLLSYIDAAMVGRLGSAQAAAVGLVSSTTWIFGSFCYANSSGFSVQIAHRCGAGDFDGAKRIFRQGLLTTLGVSAGLALLAAAISGVLPHWLGGGEDICRDASGYFLIYAVSLPALQLAVFCEAALIASGNVKVPSLVSVALCVLDAGFNYVFIFMLGLGVKGAALGTGLATLCAGVFLYFYATRRSRELRRGAVPTETAAAASPEWACPAATAPESASPESSSSPMTPAVVLKRALGISWPLWIQNLAVRGAYIAATVIIAPLGTIAIAANSFAIIAEGFCYLPGYGMQDAATTLVGQSLGSGRKDLARRFAWITIGSGASLMLLLAVLMWVFAPGMMGLLSHDPEVVSLGARCLRIEAWAEFFFGISIVAYGCCVGAGDTLVPSGINLLSMWVIRIGLALLLIPSLGLEGYWYAMAAELTVKGMVFAVRIRGRNWIKSRL